MTISINYDKIIVFTISQIRGSEKPAPGAKIGVSRNVKKSQKN